MTEIRGPSAINLERAHRARKRYAQRRITARRARLMTLHTAHTRAECALILGISVGVIRSDELALGITCVVADRKIRRDRGTVAVKEYAMARLGRMWPVKGEKP